MARMFRQFQRKNPTMIKATDCDIAMFLLFFSLRFLCLYHLFWLKNSISHNVTEVMSLSH